jgi:hypothetical protein
MLRNYYDAKCEIEALMWAAKNSECVVTEVQMV